MVDWLSASEEDRKRLYEVVKRFVDERNMHSDSILTAAFDVNVVSVDDFKNFAKGKLSRKKAHLIAKWMMENHPDYMAVLQREDNNGAALKTPINGLSWDRLIDEHAVAGVVELVPTNIDQIPSPNDANDIDIPDFLKQRKFKRSNAETEYQNIDRKSFIENAGDEPTVPHVAPPDQNKLQFLQPRRILFAEHFCFGFHKSFSAFVVALQEANKQWAPLAISEENPKWRRYKPENLPHLPCDALGQPTPLQETEHTGLHKFVFIASDTPLELDDDNLATMPIIEPQQMDALSEQLKSRLDKIAIYRVDAIFI